MGKGVGQSVLEMSYEKLNGKENNCECRGLMWALLPISTCRHLTTYPGFPGHLDPAWKINSISNRWLLKRVFFYRFDPLWPELKWISLLSSRPPHLAFKVGLEQKSQMEECTVTVWCLGTWGEKKQMHVWFFGSGMPCAFCVRDPPQAKGCWGWLFALGSDGGEVWSLGRMPPGQSSGSRTHLLGLLFQGWRIGQIAHPWRGCRGTWHPNTAFKKAN